MTQTLKYTITAQTAMVTVAAKIYETDVTDDGALGLKPEMWCVPGGWEGPSRGCPYSWLGGAPFFYLVEIGAQSPG